MDSKTKYIIAGWRVHGRPAGGQAVFCLVFFDLYSKHLGRSFMGGDGVGYSRLLLLIPID